MEMNKENFTLDFIYYGGTTSSERIMTANHIIAPQNALSCAYVYLERMQKENKCFHSYMHYSLRDSTVVAI